MSLSQLGIWLKIRRSLSLSNGSSASTRQFAHLALQPVRKFFHMPSSKHAVPTVPLRVDPAHGPQLSLRDSAFKDPGKLTHTCGMISWNSACQRRLHAQLRVGDLLQQHEDQIPQHRTRGISSGHQDECRKAKALSKSLILLRNTVLRKHTEFN